MIEYFPEDYIKVQTDKMTCQGCCFNKDPTSLRCVVSGLDELDCNTDDKYWIFKEKEND